jgi:hypothetical protein
MGVWGDLPGSKAPGHEADHSPPTSVEVRNGGAIPPFPHLSSLIKHRDNFIFCNNTKII